MPAHYTFTTRHEIDCPDADWRAVGSDKGYGLVPERILVQLDNQPTDVCALAAWDCDYWMVVSAQDLDGNEVELTPADEDRICEALDDRRERDARDY